MTWQLHLGDCIEGMRGLPDKSVDHVIADPPYEKEAHAKGRRVRIEGGSVHSGLEVKTISYRPITEAERIACAQQYARIAKRWIIVFCQSEAAHKWKEALEAAGAQYKRFGVYWKLDAQPQYSGDGPGVGWEAVVIAHGLPKRGRTEWNAGGKCARWDAAADARFGQRLEVDGQKPLSLMRQLIADFTDPGDLVLDSHAGSGTTGAACIELGRRFIGWELDPKHHATASKRLGEASKQQPLFKVATTQEQARLPL